MIDDEGAVVVPVDVVLAVVAVGDVVVEMGLNDGAGVAAGAGDNGAVGTDSEAVHLKVVEATVLVGEAKEAKFVVVFAGVDTAIGGEIIGVVSILAVDMVDGNDLTDAGMDEGGVVVDHGHVVATIEFELAGADGGPLIVTAIYKAFSDEGGGTGDDDTTGVTGVDDDGAGGEAGGVSDGHNGGGGEGAPSLLIGGEVEGIHEAIRLNDHRVEIGGVGLRDGEFHAGIGAAEGRVGGRDVDGVELVGRGKSIADAVELVARGEEGGVVDSRDDELVDTATEDDGGGLIPVVGAFGMAPAVEAAICGSVEVECAVDIEVVEGVDGAEIVVIGIGDKFEGSGRGVEAVDTDTLDGHFSVGGAVGVVVVTCTDIDGVVGALKHRVDGEGDGFAVEGAGDVMPDSGVVGHAGDLVLREVEVAIEGGEVVRAGRFKEEAAGGGAGEESGAIGILFVDDKTGDLTTDIVGTNFIETATGLGISDAPGQSQ